MSENNEKLEVERRMITEARQRGTGATLKVYARLSGPGWLQSAITLGGGSLAGSLYLGVIAGFSLLWLQPFAMILGIVMLSAIGYVALSIDERPFDAINRHVNPVLGWGWALAALLANMVWALPQYSLATGVLQQNLLPDLLGPPDNVQGKVIISVSVLLITTGITWCYGTRGWGVRIYETLLKLMVALIVICFFIVVYKLARSEQGLAWGSIFGGFIPDFGQILRPSSEFQPLLENLGPGRAEYWSDFIVDKQRDVLATAAATAVGINMTFLFPYTLIRRGWGKEFRGLATFDLSTGMLIPFLLATSCVIIASSTQFHAKPQEEVLAAFPGATLSKDGGMNKQEQEFVRMIKGRVAWQLGRDGSILSGADRDKAVADHLRRNPPSEDEKELAASLVTRDAFHLAKSLKPLTGGDLVSNIIFGIGVLGMTLSTITLLMLISGFIICEIMGLPPYGWPHRLGTLAATTGALGPFIWGEAQFWLAVPTSIFGLVLLPIAYLTFFLLMNQRSCLKGEMPHGGRRIAWNLLMGAATLVAGSASIWMVWNKSESKFGSGWYGAGAIAAFLGLALLVHVIRGRPDVE